MRGFEASGRAPVTSPLVTLFPVHLASDLLLSLDMTSTKLASTRLYRPHLIQDSRFLNRDSAKTCRRFHSLGHAASCQPESSRAGPDFTKTLRTSAAGYLPRQTDATGHITNQRPFWGSGVGLTGLIEEEPSRRRSFLFRRPKIWQRVLKAHRPRLFGVLL